MISSITKIIFPINRNNNRQIRSLDKSNFQYESVLLLEWLMIAISAATLKQQIDTKKCKILSGIFFQYFNKRNFGCFWCQFDMGTKLRRD